MLCRLGPSLLEKNGKFGSHIKFKLNLALDQSILTQSKNYITQQGQGDTSAGNLYK